MMYLLSRIQKIQKTILLLALVMVAAGVLGAKPQKALAANDDYCTNEVIPALTANNYLDNSVTYSPAPNVTTFGGTTLLPEKRMLYADDIDAASGVITVSINDYLKNIAGASLSGFTIENKNLSDLYIVNPYSFTGVGYKYFYLNKNISAIQGWLRITPNWSFSIYGHTCTYTSAPVYYYVQAKPSDECSAAGLTDSVFSPNNLGGANQVTDGHGNLIYRSNSYLTPNYLINPGLGNSYYDLSTPNYSPSQTMAISANIPNANEEKDAALNRSVADSAMFLYRNDFTKVLDKGDWPVLRTGSYSLSTTGCVVPYLGSTGISTYHDYNFAYTNNVWKKVNYDYLRNYNFSTGIYHKKNITDSDGGTNDSYIHLSNSATWGAHNPYHYSVVDGRITCWTGGGDACEDDIDMTYWHDYYSNLSVIGKGTGSFTQNVNIDFYFPNISGNNWNAPSQAHYFTFYPGYVQFNKTPNPANNKFVSQGGNIYDYIKDPVSGNDLKILPTSKNISGGLIYNSLHTTINNIFNQQIGTAAYIKVALLDQNNASMYYYNASNPSDPNHAVVFLNNSQNNSHTVNLSDQAGWYYLYDNNNFSSPDLNPSYGPYSITYQDLINFGYGQLKNDTLACSITVKVKCDDPTPPPVASTTAPGSLNVVTNVTDGIFPANELNINLTNGPSAPKSAKGVDGASGYTFIVGAGTYNVSITPDAALSSTPGYNGISLSYIDCSSTGDIAVGSGTTATCKIQVTLNPLVANLTVKTTVHGDVAGKFMVSILNGATQLGQNVGMEAGYTYSKILAGSINYSVAPSPAISGFDPSNISYTGAGCGKSMTLTPGSNVVCNVGIYSSIKVLTVMAPGSVGNPSDFTVDLFDGVSTVNLGVGSSIGTSYKPYNANTTYTFSIDPSTLGSYSAKFDPANCPIGQMYLGAGENRICTITMKSPTAAVPVVPGVVAPNNTNNLNYGVGSRGW